MSRKLESALFYTACALPGIGLAITTMKTIQAVADAEGRRK